MYCSNCGIQLADDISFCTGCGKAVIGQNPQGHEGCSGFSAGRQDLVGFSQRINDPEFARYQRDSKRWSFVFALILAVIAIIAFPIYGTVSGEIEMPYSLYYGIGIGGLFLFIAAIKAISKGTDTTWDGVVIDKKSFVKERYDKTSERFIKYTVFEYYVKRDNGRIYYHRSENDDTVYNYYNIGDKVRHHKGLGSFEKYDKSRDSFIFCNACGSINELSEESCSRCNCPLLK